MSNTWSNCGRKSAPRSGFLAKAANPPSRQGFSGGCQTAARVPGRCLVWRDERFPPGASEANRSRTARSSPQGGGAKGWQANVRPQEHEWAARQAVGGECASDHEARASLTAVCRAQRRERKEQALTRGDPRFERSGEVSRGRSSEEARRKPGRAKGRRTRRSQAKLWPGHERTDEAAGHDNCGRDSGRTKRGPNEEGAQPVRVSGVDWLRTGDGRPPERSTAGCGKPHVRWCGRVPGRNPRHPTRSPPSPPTSASSTPPNSPGPGNRGGGSGSLVAASRQSAAIFVFQSAGFCSTWFRSPAAIYQSPLRRAPRRNSA